MAYSGKVDIQQVIDDSSYSWFHWLLIVLGFLVLAIDGFDTAAMGYIAPTLSAEWGIHKQDLGPVLSAALLGLSLGALIGGGVGAAYGPGRELADGRDWGAARPQCRGSGIARGSARSVGPTYTWRGRPIRVAGSSIISRHCAIQPGSRPSANSTVNIRAGKPIAL